MANACSAESNAEKLGGTWICVLTWTGRKLSAPFRCCRTRSRSGTVAETISERDWERAWCMKQLLLFTRMRDCGCAVPQALHVFTWHVKAYSWGNLNKLEQARAFWLNRHGVKQRFR